MSRDHLKLFLSNNKMIFILHEFSIFHLLRLNVNQRLDSPAYTYFFPLCAIAAFVCPYSFDMHMYVLAPKEMPSLQDHTSIFDL